MKEIDVQWRDYDYHDDEYIVSILNGDTTPSQAEGTDFGSVDFAAGSVDLDYRIVNRGSTTLNLTGTPIVVMTGSTDFTVNAQPSAATVAAARSSPPTSRPATTSARWG